MQNILFFWKSPKSVWQCFHFFYFNLFESFQTNFVEISSFLRKKNAFKPKFVGWWHLLKMFEKETITPTRSVEIPSLQATQTKRSLEQTTVLEGGKLSRTGSSCGSLCKVKNCATLFIMSQLFICGLKTKDSFLFFPSILHISTKILSNFFFVSTIPAF